MLTNFAKLTNEQKTIWSKDLWSHARNQSFIGKFLGTDANSIIQRVTELKKSEKGARAVITLVADLVGDGVTGDNNLDGNGESMRSFDQVIRIDQLRHYVENEGKMAEQKSVVSFREQARDKLAYWLADRIDQLAFLTLAGWGYAKHPRGNTRTNSNLPLLEFADDVKAPTANRFARWNGTSKALEWGQGSNTLTAADTPTWNMFIQLKAYAKSRYVKPVRESGGDETYHVFLSEMAFAKLKQDPDYIANLRHAAARDASNPLYSGTSVKIDGLMFHEFRYVPNTLMAAAGMKWGAGGNVDGCQMLMCGAQALAFADLGDPEWNEETKDFGNRQQVETGKIFGFLKPQFENIYENSLEDFGVLSVFVAQ